METLVAVCLVVFLINNLLGVAAKARQFLLFRQLSKTADDLKASVLFGAGVGAGMAGALDQFFKRLKDARSSVGGQQDGKDQPRG